MKRRHLVLMALVLLYEDAQADEAVHFKSPSTVKTDAGSEERLPPGWFYTEAQRAALDAELKRLQAQETRLEAENVSLRASADGPSGWGVVLAFVVGAAAGFGTAYYVLK